MENTSAIVLSLHFSESETRVIKHGLIRIKHGAVGAQHLDKDGDSVGNLTQFGFRLLDFVKRTFEGLLRSLALDPLRDRVGNRCQRVDNGFRKCVTGEQRDDSDKSTLDNQRMSGEGNHSVRLCPTFILHAWIVQNVIGQMRLLLPGNPADLQVSDGNPAESPIQTRVYARARL